jgi:diguanylate cyclase (GGDEF)-like protein/PAS domain S-box-containing protein
VHRPFARRATTPSSPDRLGARVGIWLFGVGGGMTTFDAVLFLPGRPIGLVIVGLCALVAAGALHVLPWERWPRQALLALVPVALLLIFVGNSVDSDPYTASVYFFAVAIWVGLTQRPGTMVLLGPAFAFTYWLPLAMHDPLPGFNETVPYVSIACVISGEIVSMLTDRLYRTSAALQAHTERRFETLVAEASDVLIVLDATGVVTYVSPSLERMFGWRPDELVGNRPAVVGGSFMHPDDIEVVQAGFLSSLAHEGGRSTIRHRVVRPDGAWRHVESVVRNLLHDPAINGVLVDVRDVTERNELELALSHQAFHDTLTGLPNRALLVERLEQARRRGVAGAFLFCDLDGFKTINDVHGHDAGDQVLRAAATRVAREVRERDTVARLAGDEFAVLLDGVTPDEAMACAHRIAVAVHMPFAINGIEIQLSVSIGVAVLAEPWDVSDPLTDADLAMYAAKATGGGVKAYEPSLRDHAIARAELLADLRGAVGRDELVVYYQPIVELDDAVPFSTDRELLDLPVVGLEALVRWQHPVRGLVAPDWFIPLAEESRVIREIGAWVLATACRDLVALRAGTGHPDMTMAVNVSPVQLVHDDIVGRVVSALAASGLPADALVLEITESALVEPEAVTVLQRLSDIGVRLTIDDFGTGWSSLRYLHEYPIDELKIDRSFVANIAAADAAALIRTITELATRLELTTVAEGVEQPDQARAVAAMGAGAAQGYYWSRPVDRSAIHRYLSERTGPAAVPHPRMPAGPVPLPSSSQPVHRARPDPLDRIGA